MKHCLLPGVALAAIAVLLAAGCGRTPEQRYSLKGKVIAVDRDQQRVTVAHEEIPDFMDAMTMSLNVRDDWAMPVLAPGQWIEATLVVRGGRSWIEGLSISQSEESAGIQAQGEGPAVGAEVPDFSLVNHLGKAVHIRQYRGRPLLLTFIYTRCPLPDYCPRTNQQFSDVFRGIQSLPESSRRPHLLTVSFDTKNDTPEVLRKFSRRYLAREDIEGWEFATGSADQIREIASYFGLVYLEESGQFLHSLVTALIGPDGRIARLYTGNEWTARDILAELLRK